ncbi:glycoside hydrolase family protein [Anditalea andensis]|uniref:Cellulase Ig-like domain-containing protein n=1 Tax=Anditalea andensis TaxID=1048983 RepID=A0A074KSM4_9BACT|nr:hypothetical protein [Anditalea andensis]KEO71924.1 hypothetical protein EL17_20625 [Anditalea andensis]
MKKILIASAIYIMGMSAMAQKTDSKLLEQASFALAVKKPGNDASTHALTMDEKGNLQAAKSIPLTVSMEQGQMGTTLEVKLNIVATEDVYFHLQGKFHLNELQFEQAQMYLPGFWYRQNQRSPENAPSLRSGNNWLVREDRLSTPLSAIFDPAAHTGYTLMRKNAPTQIALTTHHTGEVILGGPTDMGALGFGEDGGIPFLAFAYPYAEEPYSYYRKLTLGNPVKSFLKLDKGESVSITYLLSKSEEENFSAFVAHEWKYSFDQLQPKPLEDQKFTDQEIKSTLVQFFKSSYIEPGNLKGFSGVHLLTATCEPVNVLEVGFIGRVLLNAFNALEYGEAYGDGELVTMANNVFDSYEQHGFTSKGLIRENVDFDKGDEPSVYSIRRQSEGIYALLMYFQYEKSKGRNHRAFEQKVKGLLNTLMTLQQADGSFPRKFDGSLGIIDETGGSSPSAVLPLVMAHHYFKDKRYLEAARKVATYQEVEIISKSDYFSSTLDADCEDKEASLYASTAMYYMAQVTKGKERQHYVDLAKEAAFFALSWYYTWDVPFAQGQMLGDIGLKSRGWGNVSVENNHIDVFIFEFVEVLQWLTRETKEERFAAFADVIKSSMREQLLPHKGNLMGVAKVGYYPEVVQHTAWDYGKNGKGFYNDLFAPGWTVASLWELLSDQRASRFFSQK